MKSEEKNGGQPAHSQAGFTLVEMALVLIISGMMMSLLLMAYKYFVQGDQKKDTIESIEKSQSLARWALDETGYYPCPADPTLEPGDADYGRPDCGIDSDGNINPNIVRLNGYGGIALKGAFPFLFFLDPDGDGDTSDSLFTTEEYKYTNGFDAWGNKLSYVVSESQTNIDADADGNPDFTFDQDAGVIEVVDETVDLSAISGGTCENDYSLLETCGTAHFLVFSHGPNGVGAFNKEGKQHKCNTGFNNPNPNPANPGATVTSGIDETENCENANGDDAIFISGIYSQKADTVSDDLLKFTVYKKVNIWQVNNTLGLDGGHEVFQISNTNPGNVGLGIDTPDQKLSVSGDIQGIGIHAVEFCDTTGQFCMPPDAIGGELAQMQCPPGEIVTQILHNSVKCTPPFSGAIVSGTCPSGTYLAGLSTTNGPICRAKPNY